MYTFSEKVFLQLDMPTEDAPVSDQARILQGLADLGFDRVHIPLPVLRQLYPLCREAGYAITASLVCRGDAWILTGVEAGDQRQQHYGLAVDYGSTTIVMQLVDLHNGSILAEENEINGQAVYGSDILTRITYSLEDPSHLDDLHAVTVRTFDTLLSRLTARTGVDATRCPAMILSGNTTMIHFLLKLNAWSVFAAPYAPVSSDPGWFSGGELGMNFSGMVYIIPAASNYVGGDIVSGLIHLGIHRQAQTSMFFDIGTNGELVVGNREWIIAGAGAAGPALEGYISRYGMRADSGAIDSVKIHGNQLFFTTIDGAPPVGICGSGIIDLLAQMRLNGWINISGELNPQASERIVYLADEQQYVVEYATAAESANSQPLFFAQQDILQYLDTKAAAYTMIECILETAGCEFADLQALYLSGAFPAHSDLESAITIGIFPDLPREKYHCTPNTSLEGARQLLLDRQLLQEIQLLLETMYCVQFASYPDFLVRMQAAKFIPHTDLRRYPSIVAKL